jgi:hypothetical protein
VQGAPGRPFSAGNSVGTSRKLANNRATNHSLRHPRLLRARVPKPGCGIIPHPFVEHGNRAATQGVGSTAESSTNVRELSLLKTEWVQGDIAALRQLHRTDRQQFQRDSPSLSLNRVKRRQTTGSRYRRIARRK